MFSLAQPALAAVFMVTEAYDSIDASPGDGDCADASGRCTLRAAVQESNASSGEDIITLPAGTYTLSIPGNAEHAAVTGDLDLRDGVTVRGQGADRTVINAGGIDRAFETINSGTVLIENLTIENGVAGANTPGFFTTNVGGAIATVGDTSTLTLNNVVLRNNQALSGGGLYNVYSTVVINNSAIHDNDATTGSGGGLAEGLASFTRLYNVTLSGNRAAQNGGGMFTSNNTALMYNVTVTGNLADSDANGTGNGGGLSKGITGATLSNSIVAGNSDTGGEAPDCDGTLTSHGYNLIGTANGCTVTPTSGDQIGSLGAPIDPGLQALAEAESGVPMFALSAGSPAIDAGNPAVPDSGGDACLATDARGANRVINTPCDIGAYEVATFGRSFDVNSLDDVPDASLGDGVCETASGNQQCTLRAAIQEANLLDGMDTINVPAGTITLTRAGANEDMSATGDLDITQATRIVGAGLSQTSIDGDAQDRVFHLNTTGRVEMQGLTIRNGVAGSGNGGGILLANTGGLDLTDIQISGNSAESGGGVYASLWSWMNDGMVNLTRCVISGNTANQYGGGFANYTFRVTKITASTFSDNSAQMGGALFNSFMSYALVTGSTISGNQAQVGGGMALLWGNGVVTLVNSTVSANTATQAGGGVNVESADTLNVFSSTVTANRAIGAATGGGINAAGTVRLGNSVLAGNTDQSIAAPDCAAAVTSLGYNLVGNDSGCTLAALASDQIGTSVAPLDPRLDVLATHGDALAYHVPFTDSPLLNAGNPVQPGSGGNSCPGSDQRGVDRSLNAPCDIGAVELASADIGLVAAVEPSTVTRAGAMDYVMQITNAGPDIATAVSLALVPVAGSVYVSASGTDWTCTANAGNVLCLGPDLANGAVSELTLTYTAPDNSGSLVSTAGISTDSWDVDSSNNSVSINFVSNAPPIITGGSAITYTGTPDTVQIATAIALTDIDDVNIESATLRIASGFVAGEDLLYASVYSGLSAHWDDINGVLSISGTAPLSVYEAVLRNIRYTNLANPATSGSRLIQMVVNDGVFDSAAITILLELPPVASEKDTLTIPAVPEVPNVPVVPDVPASGEQESVSYGVYSTVPTPTETDDQIESVAPVEQEAVSENEVTKSDDAVASVSDTATKETQNRVEDGTAQDGEGNMMSASRLSFITRAGRAAQHSLAATQSADAMSGQLEVASIASAEFWEEISSMQAQMATAETAEMEQQKLVMNTAKTVTVFLFAGATSWYVKGSALLASLFTSLPLWARFDPLPILALSRRMRKRREGNQAAAEALEKRYSSGMTRLLDTRAAQAPLK